MNVISLANKWHSINILMNKYKNIVYHGEHYYYSLITDEKTKI